MGEVERSVAFWAHKTRRERAARAMLLGLSRLQELVDEQQAIVESVNERLQRMVVDNRTSGQVQALKASVEAGVTVSLASFADGRAVRYSVTNQREIVQFYTHLAVTSDVDSFNIYLSDLLHAIFKLRPEILRSTDTVPLDWALEHSTMSDLIEAIARRKVDAVTGRGFREIRRFLRDRMGLDPSVGPDDLLRVDAFIATRNAIVHAGTLVDAIAEPFAISEPTLEVIQAQQASLATVTNAIDVAAIGSFPGLPRDRKDEDLDLFA